MKIYSVSREEMNEKFNGIIPGFALGDLLFSFYNILQGTTDYNSDKWIKVMKHWVSSRASV
jgi:hypothetical protein